MELILSSGEKIIGKECGKQFISGKYCECQRIYFAEDTITGQKGYWCCRCHSYRGTNGYETGRSKP